MTTDVQFFYTLATIFATITAIFFAILLNSLQSLSIKYNSPKIVSRFFRKQKNKWIYAILCSGIIISLISKIFSFEDNNLKLISINLLLLLIICLILLFSLCKDFGEYVLPSTLITSPMKDFIKVRENKKEKDPNKIKKIQKEFLEEIKEILINSPPNYAKEGMEKIDKMFLNFEKPMDRNLLDASCITEIGKEWAKKNSSVSFEAIHTLISFNYINKIKCSSDFQELFITQINCADKIIDEINKYQNRDFNWNDVVLIFNQAYISTENLEKTKIGKDNKIEGIKKILELIGKIQNLSSALISNEKELLSREYKQYTNGINSFLSKIK